MCTDMFLCAYPIQLLLVPVFILEYLQSRDYRGYLEGKQRRNGDEQRPARGIAALQISNTTINPLFRPGVTNLFEPEGYFMSTES